MEATPTIRASSTLMGMFIFKPVQANFVKGEHYFAKIDPYCKIELGHHSNKTEVAWHQGKHPKWNDVIVLGRKHCEQSAKLKVRDRNPLHLDERLGETMIPLDNIPTKGNVQQWFKIYKGDKVTGEVLMKIKFQPLTMIVA